MPSFLYQTLHSNSFTSIRALSSTQRSRFKMSSGEHQISIHEYDQKLDEKMQVETSNKDNVSKLDYKDHFLFEKLKEKNDQEEENNSSNGQGQDSKPVTKIQRVPDVMKAEKDECSEKYFTPKAIAIGPIHAHSDKVFVREELKLMWAAKYLDGLDEKKILKDIKHEIDWLMKNFDRECLDKDAKDVHGTLARMLFVDGCAMLQFIYSFVWDEDFLKHLKINAAQADLVQQDLFLLENQIPFRVLQIIMNEGKNKQQKEKEKKKKNKSDSKKLTKMEKGVQMSKSNYEKLTKMQTAVKMFIHLSNMLIASRPEISLKHDGAVHLLDLLRLSLLDDSGQPDDSSNRAFDCLRYLKFIFLIFSLLLRVIRGTLILLVFVIVLFLPVMHIILFSPNTQIAEYDPISSVSFLDITRRTFRNVQDLKAAGIVLKPSKSRCLGEVSFSSGLFGGCLRLCPILVDKSTAGKLLNLIAYEMCPDYNCKTTKDSKSYDYRISSYLSFLVSLIDNEHDVKDLRAANILRHHLSSDKEVAELFNDIIPNSVADDAYGDVNTEIQKYYERNIGIWITELRQEYLRSPWTLLALIAAAAALGSTATQTYFTINPR